MRDSIKAILLISSISLSFALKAQEEDKRKAEVMCDYYNRQVSQAIRENNRQIIIERLRLARQCSEFKSSIMKSELVKILSL